MELVSYWISTFIITSFLQLKLEAFIEMVVCTLVRRWYGRKRPMSIKYDNFDFRRRWSDLLMVEYTWIKINIKLIYLVSLYISFKSDTDKGFQFGFYLCHPIFLVILFACLTSSIACIKIKHLFMVYLYLKCIK